MLNKKNNIIPHIIEQHAEEAAFLWLLRCEAVNAPVYDLDELEKLDERVEAHLDGLRIAGNSGWQFCYDNLLAMKEVGELFAASVLAIESHSKEKIDLIYDVVKESPDILNGLVSALGWVKAHHLQGMVSDLLSSDDALFKQIGLSACAVHRVDPADVLEKAIEDKNSSLCVRALKVTGELGRVDLLPLILKQLHHENKEIRFWAAWSAVLLGDRNTALKFLHNETLSNSEFSHQAMQLFFYLLDPQSINQILKILIQNEQTLVLAILGAGFSGDPVYVPWLIQQMEKPEYSKISAESFAYICGVDLAEQNLDADSVLEEQTGPSEDPDDEDVEMDPNEDLVYPSVELVLQWWQENKHQFTPNQRYCYGKPFNEQQVEWVLRNGSQRLRQNAAILRALFKPEQIVFNVKAVGKCQKQLLN